LKIRAVGGRCERNAFSKEKAAEPNLKERRLSRARATNRALANDAKG